MQYYSKERDESSIVLGADLLLLKNKKSRVIFEHWIQDS